MDVASKLGASGPGASVVFVLEVDKDGWPPVSSERVWAFDLGDGLYRIDNPPWFISDLAVGDVVEASAPTPSSHPVFQRLVDRSDHITIRLICFREGPLAGNLQRVVDAFVPLGVYAEGVQQYRMVALDVPPTAPLREVFDRLSGGVGDGSWEYEEGRITQAWIEASS
jgi:hypothetical protein